MSNNQQDWLHTTGTSVPAGQYCMHCPRCQVRRLHALVTHSTRTMWSQVLGSPTPLVWAVRPGNWQNSLKFKLQFCWARCDAEPCLLRLSSAEHHCCKHNSKMKKKNHFKTKSLIASFYFDVVQFYLLEKGWPFSTRYVIRVVPLIKVLSAKTSESHLQSMP